MAKSKLHTLDKTQISFDFEAVKWPDQLAFPLNRKRFSSVEEVIYKDIESSTSFLIVTGFTSLSNLVDYFGSGEFKQLKKVRILIGFEPNIRGRRKYETVKLEKEVKEYWLRKGLSILSGGAVMNLIEKINEGAVEFRYRDKLHAKLYVGDNHAVLGSSNFSKNGLTTQEEANIRVARYGESERTQYESIQQIAENYYEESESYNEKIKELLKDLIQQVSWEEALARAIAEILEGEWLTEYHEILEKLQNARLWPTQWKGLAQAVSILQSQSNVLIADPTGAGKTKLSTSLVLALKHWLYELGKNYHTDSLVICPPLVVKKWEEEFRSLRRINSSQLSMGLLSNAGGKNKKKVEDYLNFAKILAIDEAHNYLSPTSNRTKLIKSNRADYKILVTATPISKRVEDLLRLIELLDLDNLSDEDFDSYKDLVNKPHLRNQDQHIEKLRRFISKFTVRRTKKALNLEIEKDPDRYKNKLDRTCKFPKQVEQTYLTKETDKDKSIVEKINELASNLKGVTYLTSFKKPNFVMTQGDSIKAYIDKRISAGKALSVYMIRSALRSSHVALIEHIEGTEYAMNLFKFRGKTKATGDKISIIQELIDKNHIPRKYKIFKDEFFPEWLIDHDKYFEACRTDLKIYKQISDLAKKLSGEREAGKVETLFTVSQKHDYVLAFDSTVITLYYLLALFKRKYPEKKVLVASGSENQKDSNQVIQAFDLLSETDEQIIALCSDKMSESIDLQKASCVMLLDLPSVLRVVEQRIGRADRMDSLHDSIDIYWPNDSEEYSLNADKRIVQTNDWVDQIYGSNFKVPEDIQHKHFENVSNIDELRAEFKEFIDKDESWAGVTNSFQPIIDLKEGKDTIISEDTYEYFKGVHSSVKTRVSFLESEKNWCFIALRGDKIRSPKWYFIDELSEIHTDFPDICRQLRLHISSKSSKLAWNDSALKKYILHFKRKERELLPPKKKRVLDVAEFLLEKQLRRQDQNTQFKEVAKSLLLMLKSNTEDAIDYERLADEWIIILQPHLNARREMATRRKRILNFSCLKEDFRRIDLPFDALKNIIDSIPIVEDIDNKIAACIIGVAE